MAGVGKALRIYDIGKKKLLRKCENKVRVCSSVKNFNDSVLSPLVELLLGDCHAQYPRLAYHCR